MGEKPKILDVVKFMEEDFIEFIIDGKMNPGEALSRLVDEYEGVRKLGHDYNQAIKETAMKIAKKQKIDGTWINNIDKEKDS